MLCAMVVVGPDVPGDLLYDWSVPERIETHCCDSVVEPMQHALQGTTASILCLRRNKRNASSCGGCNVALEAVGDHEANASSKPWRRIDREAELQNDPKHRQPPSPA